MKTVTVRATVNKSQPISVQLTEAEIVGLYTQTYGRKSKQAHQDLAKFLLESIDHPLNGWLDQAATAPLDSVLVPTTWLERLRDALRDWTEATQ